MLQLLLYCFVVYIRYMFLRYFLRDGKNLWAGFFDVFPTFSGCLMIGLIGVLVPKLGAIFVLFLNVCCVLVNQLVLVLSSWG